MTLGVAIFDDKMGGRLAEISFRLYLFVFNLSALVILEIGLMGSGALFLGFVEEDVGEGFMGGLSGTCSISCRSVSRASNSLRLA